MNKRIFFALNFPEKLKEEIKENYWKEMDSKELKKVKKENIHITLLFLGYFPEEKINEIKEKIEKIEKEKFVLEIKGAGSFKSKVIFLKIEKGKEKIKELYKEICNAMEMPEEKFTAHATIARNKKMKPKEFEELVKKLEKISFEKEIEIKSFELMESVLHSSGSEYKTIFSFNLCL
jgi:2'-5' RNA ligase